MEKDLITDRMLQSKINAQANEVISQFCKDVYNMANVQVSRDKNGHILVLHPGQSLMDLDVINCYILGTYKQKSPYLALAGELYYDCETNSIMDISNLSVDKRFRNNGIAKVMLQHAENLAKRYGCPKIIMDSYLNRTPIQGCINPNQDAYNYALSIDDNNNYFDKTLYIYASMGFKPTGTSRNSNCITLVKQPLRYMSVANGLITKIKNVAPTDQAFKITDLHRFNEATTDMDITLGKKPLPANFKLITFEPTHKNLENLQKLLLTRAFGD